MSSWSRFHVALFVLLGLLIAVTPAQPAFAQDTELPVGKLDPSVNKFKYPKAAKRVLGKALLKRLPRLITAYLVDEDWVAIQRMCKTLDPDAVMHCISKSAAPIMKMVRRRIVGAVAALIDSDMPATLSLAQTDTLDAACGVPAKAWAECTIKGTAARQNCDAGAAASCLTSHDMVVKSYLAVVASKRQAFGDALYNDLSGVLSQLSVSAIEQVRKDCAQRELSAVIACFSNHPVAGQHMRRHLNLARAIVASAAQELNKHNVTLVQADYTTTTNAALLRLPLSAIRQLVVRCAKAHPEFAEPKTVADVDGAMACLHREGLSSAIANPVYVSASQLDSWLSENKTRITESLVKQSRQRRQRNLGRMWIGLGFAGLVGLISLLLIPFVLTKKDSPASPAKASALFVLTLICVVGALGVGLTAVHYGGAHVANARTSTTNAGISALERKHVVAGFSTLSKSGLDFFKAPLNSVAAANNMAEPLSQLSSQWRARLVAPQFQKLTRVLHGREASKANTNTDAASLKRHTSTLASASGLYRLVDGLLGLVPMLLAMFAVVLFLLPLRRALTELGPSGEIKSTLLAEARHALPFVGGAIVLAALIGVLLAYAIAPLVEVFAVNSALSVFHLAGPDVSTFSVFVGTACTCILMLLCVAMYVFAFAISLRALRRVRLRSEFSAYWRRAGLSLLLLLSFPLLFSHAVLLAYNQHVGSASLAASSQLSAVASSQLSAVASSQLSAVASSQLSAAPLTALMLFPILFWAVRGLNAAAFILRLPTSDSVPASSNSPSA